jgi:hypothetical protein
MFLKAVGDRESDFETAFEVIEEIWRADGTAGWTFMAGLGNLTITGVFLSEAAVASGNRYRIAEDFGFASGSTNATWMLGGRDNMRAHPSGLTLACEMFWLLFHHVLQDIQFDLARIPYNRFSRGESPTVVPRYWPLTGCE